MAYISNIDAISASSGTTKNYKIKDSEARSLLGSSSISSIGDGTVTGAINTLYTMIQNISGTIYTVTLSAASWTLNSTTGYYTQSVTVSGVTSTSKFKINGIVYPSGTTLDSKAGIDFAASLLLNGDTQTNSIVFSAVEKPDTNFTLEIEVK